MVTESPRVREWSDVRRLLCVRLDNLGDVLMCSPAIAALRLGLKDANGETSRRHVTLWGSRAGCAIAASMPDIDATIPYDAPWVAAGRDNPLDADLIARLAARRFDAAVIFTTYSQSALPAATLCALAGIPLRLAQVRENPYNLLTHWVRETEPEIQVRHEVERQLALVAHVGARPSEVAPRLALQVGDEARRRIDAMLPGLMGDGKGLVVIHPGASAPSRRWSPWRFAGVAASLADEGFAIAVTGSQPESGLVAEVVDLARGRSRHGARIDDLAGVLTLPDLIALIDRALVLVSNNSGPVHIAAARGTPVVDIYALTNPQHTPWSVPHRVLNHDVPCRNCYGSVCRERHHRCIEGVSIAAVVGATHDLVEETGGAMREPPLVVRDRRAVAAPPLEAAC